VTASSSGIPLGSSRDVPRQPSRETHSGHAQESRSEAGMLYAGDEEYRELCAGRSPTLLLLGHQALGFLSYVEKVKKLHSERSLLFPFPRRREVVRRGDAVGQWHQRHCRKVGVSGKKPLHSFRHTVVTRLIGVGVPQDKVMMIVGHTDSTVAGGIYTDRQMIPLTLLRDCLERLEYEVLDHARTHA
jgi:integrase